MAPNIPKPTNTPMMVAIEKVEERKSFSGMSASSFIAISMKMNAMIPRAPIT